MFQTHFQRLTSRSRLEPVRAALKGEKVSLHSYKQKICDGATRGGDHMITALRFETTSHKNPIKDTFSVEVSQLLLPSVGKCFLVLSAADESP